MRGEGIFLLLEGEKTRFRIVRDSSAFHDIYLEIVCQLLKQLIPFVVIFPPSAINLHKLCCTELFAQIIPRLGE